MDIKSFNFGEGVVTYQSVELFADELPDSSTEDLLQIEYIEKKLVLDVGWDFRTKTYIVCVVVYKDWRSPVFSKQAKTLKRLELMLNEAIKWIGLVSMKEGEDEASSR